MAWTSLSQQTNSLSSAACLHIERGARQTAVQAGSHGLLPNMRTPRLPQAQEERARGFFDEAGNYVEREDKEEADAQDAWLQSDEGAALCHRHRCCCSCA